MDKRDSVIIVEEAMAILANILIFAVALFVLYATVRYLLLPLIRNAESKMDSRDRVEAELAKMRQREREEEERMRAQAERELANEMGDDPKQ